MANSFQQEMDQRALYERFANAQALVHMLEDLVCAQDGVPDSDPNYPRGRTQRMHACIEGLRGQLIRIEAIAGDLGRLDVKEASHG